ncbi:MAG: IcmT/TraK family protein [Pseudomonadota bacterium]
MRDLASAHWRNSARRPKLWIIDAYAAFPLLLFLLHIRWWTFTLALGTMLFFGILERFGFTLPIFRRFLRATIAGAHRTARPWWL